jgi:hypothetical protein
MCVCFRSCVCVFACMPACVRVGLLTVEASDAVAAVPFRSVQKNENLFSSHLQG